MKETIIAALKRLFPNNGLSAKRLSQIAAVIEKKVGTDEAQVDAAISSFNDYNPLADIRSEDDRVRGLEAKVRANEKPKPPEGGTPGSEEHTETDNDPSTPAYVKAMQKQLGTLMDTMKVLQGEKIQSVVRTAVSEKLKGKAPESYWGKRALPDSLEKVDEFVTEVQDDYKTFYKEVTKNDLKQQSGVHAGTESSAEEQSKAVVDPGVKAFAERQAAIAKSTTSQPAKSFIS